MAEALGEAGAKIMLTSRKAADLEEAAADLQAKGIDARWIAADASRPGEEVQRVVDETMQRLGRSTSWSTTPAPPGAPRPRTTRWRPGTR
jgi:NAD(P)-dependent dehydrogenase (short-subunit alcohol dehydrogenase family)